MARSDEYSRLCATKQSRDKCLATIQQLAASHGATVDLHEFNGPRELGMELCLGPYACMIHFDGDCRSGAFMGHWHMNRAEDCDSATTYPDTFWRVGSLNRYHKQKATTICNTFAEFLEKLSDGLNLLTRPTT